MDVPVYLMYAHNDWLADEQVMFSNFFIHATFDSLYSLQDVKTTLIPKLPNLIGSYLVPYQDFNHVDFLWAIDAPELVYGELFKQLENNK